MKAKEIINWVVYFVCLLAVVFVINTFVVQRTMVSGDSMYPYLHNKDQLMMDKLSYRFHDPERFDIVIFPVVRDGKEEYYIKRVIGLPGETVQIIDGYVYINGEKLDENYGAEVMNDAGRAAEPITLGDDEYFVLGDNRNRSDDSRYENVENLKREKIVGRAWVRIWPLDRICVVRHQQTKKEKCVRIRSATLCGTFLNTNEMISRTFWTGYASMSK